VELARTDCSRCRSARSVEHGICQVCLAESPPRPVLIGTAMAKHFVHARREMPRVDDGRVLAT
jgi:hypothetical protein